jgi:hypothetical protein
VQSAKRVLLLLSAASDDGVRTIGMGVHQAAALSVDGVLAKRVFANTTVGWIELIQWAAAWPERMWAVGRLWLAGT